MHTTYQLLVEKNSSIGYKKLENRQSFMPILHAFISRFNI